MIFYPTLVAAQFAVSVNEPLVFCGICVVVFQAILYF